MLKTIDELSKEKFLVIFKNGEYLIFDTKQDAIKASPKSFCLLKRFLISKTENNDGSTNVYITYKFFNRKGVDVNPKIGKIKCVELFGHEAFWTPKMTYGVGSSLTAKFLDSNGNLEKIRIRCPSTVAAFPILLSFFNSLSEINDLQIAKMMGLFDKELSAYTKK